MDNPTTTKKCQGCGNHRWDCDFRPVLCLGCELTFERCLVCFPKFTACGEVCKEKHREKLAGFFGPNAPPLRGG